MIKLTDEQKSRIEAFAKEYEEKYLKTDVGKRHLRSYDKERDEVKRIFKRTKEKYEKDEDITEDVLRHLLPHSDTKYIRKKGYRVSTWPAITKDVKLWFEGIGWQKKENWPNVAKSIFKLLDGLIKEKSERPIQEFLQSKYSKGFQAGMISPILYCLDDSFLVINSKTGDTVNYLIETDAIDSRLENYLRNIEIISDFLKKSGVSILDSYDKFDAFCHWMCSRRLGGYARMKKETEEAPEFEEKIDVSGLSHWDVIGMLTELGNTLQVFKTYVADPSKKYKERRLGAIATLEELPEDIRNIPRIRRIDVVWISESIRHPSYFFEVDYRGDMKGALSKLYQTMRLNAKIFVVSPLKNRPKFEKAMEIEPYKSIREMVNFRSFEALVRFFQNAKIYDEAKKDFLG